MSLTDRRRYPRFPFHSRAQLLFGEAAHHGTLLDISYSGALFSPDDHIDVPRLTACNLTIYRSGRPTLLAIGGTIMHQGDHLLGIQFREIDEALGSELRQLIDMNLAVPRLLERDLPALLRQSA